jgi:DNA modification methylase
MTNLMRQFVKPGQTVLDPFVGGGSTGLAALDLGARFIGCDVDPNAVEISQLRLDTWTAPDVLQDQASA